MLFANVDYQPTLATPGPHKIAHQAAGIVWLACGCHMLQSDYHERAKVLQ